MRANQLPEHHAFHDSWTCQSFQAGDFNSPINLVLSSPLIVESAVPVQLLMYGMTPVEESQGVLPNNSASPSYRQNMFNPW